MSDSEKSLERWFVAYPQAQPGRTRGVVFDRSGRHLLLWRRAHSTIAMLDTYTRQNPTRLQLREPINFALSHPLTDQFMLFERQGTRALRPGTNSIGPLKRLPGPAEVGDYDERGNLIALVGKQWIMQRHKQDRWQPHSKAPEIFLKRADRGVLVAQLGWFIISLYDEVRAWQANGTEIELPFGRSHHKPTIAVDQDREFLLVGWGPEGTARLDLI
ncbi:MAG: hypothetical protein HN348_19795, partial [Proteobacteria bacterium]|nr:hypothetical protein [Pseudomonadota bacterium]